MIRQDAVPAMEVPSRACPFRAGDWMVHPDLNCIERDGTRRLLEPRMMDTLVYLAQRAAITCPREQIMQDVWGTRALVDGVVTKTISELRRLLDDDADAPRYVQTVSRRGYRWIAPVAALSPGHSAAQVGPAPAAELPGRPGPAGSRRGHAVLLTLLALVVIIAAAWTLPARNAVPAQSEARVRSIEVQPIQAQLPSDEHYLAHGIGEQAAIALAASGHFTIYAPQPVGGRAGSRQADAVLGGRLWRNGEQLQLNLFLTRSPDGRMLWARQFHSSPDSAFELVGAVVTQLAGELATAPGESQLHSLQRRNSRAPGAYLSYLRARQLWSERDAADMVRARELLKDAIASDPDFALAHAALADVSIALANYRVLDREEAFGAAQAAARLAMALDPELPEANRAMGWMLLNVDWDFARARAHFERAIARNGSDATAHQLYAECLSILGDHSAARAAIARAIELQPGSPLMHAVAGLVAHVDTRHEDALIHFARALELGPRFSWLHRYRADSFVRLGQPAQAVAARLDLVRATPVPAAAQEALDEAVQSAGLDGYWRWQVEQFEQAAARGDTVEIALLAEAYAANGRREEALALVERVVQARGEYFLVLRHSPAFDPLRADAGYRELLERSALQPGVRRPPAATNGRAQETAPARGAAPH